MRNSHAEKCNFKNYRRGRSFPKKKRLLIVCEGRETEPNYFDRLKREGWAKNHFDIKVKRGKGGSREEIAQYAVDRVLDLGSDIDYVWCVMDVEAPSQKESLGKAIRTLLEHSITPCLSNPAFEVWLLSHFEKTGRVFYDGDAVKEYLNTHHWKKHFNNNEYQKADESIYERLKQFLETAIENAQWVCEEHHGTGRSIVEANSSTKVYELISFIRTGRNNLDPASKK